MKALSYLDMTLFAPLPGTYVALRINAVASVEEFEEPTLSAIAAKLSTRTYIALLSCVSREILFLQKHHSI